MRYLPAQSVDVRKARKALTPDSVCTLHPGDVALGERGETFETLLGSCVAVILTDPRRTVGVMCHIVHAKPPLNDIKSSTAYSSVAIDTMEDLLLARGITPRLCQAYVYGGGNMFPHLARKSPVGENNLLWSLDALQDRGIAVVERDIGGCVYRRVRWTVGLDAPQVESIPV